MLFVFITDASSLSSSESILENISGSSRYLREHEDVHNGVKENHHINHYIKEKREKVINEADYKETSSLQDARQMQDTISDESAETKFDTDENKSNQDSEQESLSISIQINEILAREVTFFVTASVPSTVWCKIANQEESIPSIEELKKEDSIGIQSRKSIHVDQLSALTNYRISCYAESLTGLPMVNSIQESSLDFKTRSGAATCLLSII